MPKGPKGERRAADLNKRAFSIVQIASGEADEVRPRAQHSKAGMAGGKARAAKLSGEKRSAIGRAGAQKRWNHKRNKDD